MKHIIAVFALTLAAAGCGETTEEVVQQTPQGAQEVSETRADVATTAAAVAFGMTREQLEDADLLSPDLTDLGDVETLMIDPQGRLTHVVIDLESTESEDVIVPVADITSIKTADGSINLQTKLTSAQLQALPKWSGANANANAAAPSA